ncbi:hypothetical protein LOZ80_15175 [Paenibacillus sp. HWE-109]|uniref:hypothetical protein n=1 Tax=Paenibacillus sp. HWE-109 TaxID=1306526 RepID=UPI001EDEF4E7|nr:hypothetical protein [Paenibacillus sp. HWE-109]UKS30202.1 hypothetical protein LOZ80_15175 [Paenibacillus sp. HWE-109]
MSRGLDRFEEPAEPITVAHCAWCGREIYVGTEVKRLDDGGGFVHGEECAKDYAFERVYDAEGTITAQCDVE